MRYLSFFLIMVILWTSSCNSNSEADISSADSVTLSSSIIGINSPSRKIIHTANARCRVANVYTASQQLEHMVNALDGRVTESSIVNEVINSKTLHYKPDSQKIVQEYRGTAHLTLRVPAMFTDTVMKMLPVLAEFMDARTLKQTDVTLAYLSNALKNEAAGVAPPVIADHKTGGLKPSTAHTTVETGKADTVTYRRIQNMQILDDVNYATLTVELYQPIGTDVTIAADPAFAARISFGTRVSVALADGLDLLKPIVVFVIQIWPLWFIGIGSWYLYGLFKKRRALRVIAK